MMFTSHFAIIALFAFLAGANASCVACHNTIESDGVVYTLYNSTVESNGYTLCTYDSKSGTDIACEYSDNGIRQDGDELSARDSNEIREISVGEASNIQAKRKSCKLSYKIPACHGLTPLTATSSMMFTARFAIIALFAFLAGANASCPACHDTFEAADGVVYTLSNSTVEANGDTLCTYDSKSGDSLTCEYTLELGVAVRRDGDHLCPHIAKVDHRC
ncbi:hypothetical protein BDR06DRAFT_1017876 [Suillus hirtellus]|nr:hypothetical protein BDR06DRAFT_1017876 [Suillus hirtellus]